MNNLKDNIKKLGIKGALFDLDDTLFYTNDHYMFYLRDIATYLNKITKIDVEELFKLENKYIDEVFISFGGVINENVLWPPTWTKLLESIEMKKELQKEVHPELMERTMRIYSSSPKINPFTIELLESLKDTGIKIACVTHASPKWTKLKLNSYGLEKYFDVVHNCDIDKPKSKIDWLSASEKIEIDSKDCFSIGDNMKGDVISPIAIGVRYPIWYDPGKKGWRVYTLGEIPIQARRLTDLKKFNSVLDEFVKDK